MTVNKADDSLARLICALEREIQCVESGQMSEPQRYVSLLFAAFQDQEPWLDAVTMLRSRMEELERRYDRGSAFDKKRELLLKELSSLKVECRPAAVNEADAQFQLDVWCEALSGKYVDRISADPAQAARELQEAFEDWRLVKPTENSLRNVLIELKEAAAENALTPMRGIILLLGCLAMPDLTLLSVERLCSAEHEEYGPTVHEILAIVQWIKALPNTAGDKASGGQPAPPNVARGFNPSEDAYRFECDAETVQFCGFDETVRLERTEGVDRLIAIVTRGRVNVMELMRISTTRPQKRSGEVDAEADRLSERGAIDLKRTESQLGEDALDGVHAEIAKLIEDRNAAKSQGDSAEAARLTAIINVALQSAKCTLQKAARTVRKSLDRTYERLCKNGSGKVLSAHFEKWVVRQRREWDYVYLPDPSQEKIHWIVK